MLDVTFQLLHFSRAVVSVGIEGAVAAASIVVESIISTLLANATEQIGAALSKRIVVELVQAAVARLDLAKAVKVELADKGEKVAVLEVGRKDFRCQTLRVADDHGGSAVAPGKMLWFELERDEQKKEENRSDYTVQEKGYSEFSIDVKRTGNKEQW